MASTIGHVWGPGAFVSMNTVYNAPDYNGVSYLPSAHERARKYDAYALLHAAASHIEQHPDLYDFRNGLNQGDKRCMLGRIAQIACLPYLDANTVASHVLKINPQDFFDCITTYILNGGVPGADSWCLHKPRLVVGAMRRLAEEHYSPEALARRAPVAKPAEKPAAKPVALAPPAPPDSPALPDSVRDIFKKGVIERVLDTV